MNEEEKRILTLLNKCKLGTASEAETRELNAWYDSFIDESKYTSKLDKDEIKLLRENLRQRIFYGIGYKEAASRINYRVAKKLLKAALLTAAAILVVITFHRFWHGEKLMDKRPANVLTQVLPGKNRALLRLPDGKMLNLDGTKKGIVVENGAITYVDGSIVANAAPEEHVTVQELLLSTPRGGQYRVTLPDGSRVWLNAASSLKYPTVFLGGQRKVELNGEAFFEVTTMKDRPFIVSTNGQEVRVLGTSFNIKSYCEENIIYTTLVSGKVSVIGDGHKNEQVLLPGEQSVMKGGILSKTMINLDTELAWKEGRFSFDHKNLQEVMTEVARWYDLDVVYEGRIPDLAFFGGVYRNSDVGTVLNMLETNGIGYRLQGHQLIIKKAVTIN
ncbi:FecR family protein [bacterium A37T11]|nr:FecR family protein [bacterium A37T11]